MPLRASCSRTSVIETGWGSERLTGPTLTPAESPDGWVVGAAAPATGSTTCGRAFGTAALEPDVDVPLAELATLRCEPPLADC
jgi:hypothetical protein